MSMNRDFRRAVEADGQQSGSDPTVGVQDKRADAAKTAGIFASKWRQIRSTDDWETHLAAVGMA